MRPEIRKEVGITETAPLRPDGLEMALLVLRLKQRTATERQYGRNGRERCQDGEYRGR